MDSKTRGESLSTRVLNGMMTPNEAREKEDMSAYDGGDQFYMPANILSITNPPAQQTGGDNDSNSSI
jgi:hypothetical protein